MYITLANQVAETVVGVGVVRAVVERFRPFSADLLRIDLRFGRAGQGASLGYRRAGDKTGRVSLVALGQQ